MAKYKEIETDIYSIFDTSQWKAENIKTIPINFVPTNLGNEYIRVGIVLSDSTFFSGRGIIIIDIFVPTGTGSKRAIEIADKLDSYFLSKTLSTSTGKVIQGFTSNLNGGNPDRDNVSLFKTTYNLNFNYYGVK